MSLHVAIVLVGALALLSFLSSIVALHFLPTGYSPIIDPVSNYGVGRFGFLYHLQSASSGIVGGCLFLLLILETTRASALGLSSLAVYAIARLLIGFFPTDIAPPRTATGIIHNVLATLTFLGIALATAFLGAQLSQLGAGSGAHVVISAFACVTQLSAVATVVCFMIPSLHRIAGLAERGIYLGTLGWFTAIVAILIVNV
jgi:hypothetical protein